MDGMIYIIRDGKKKSTFGGLFWYNICIYKKKALPLRPQRFWKLIILYNNMKKFLYLTMVLLFGAMGVSTVQANDYLEHSEHYTVMNMGNGVYRFTIPIWVYGAWTNYYLESSNDRDNNDDSYIWYSEKPNQSCGSSDVHRIATVRAIRVGKNKINNYDGEGEGQIYVHEGSVVIQNMFSGEKVAIQAGDDTYYKSSNSLLVKRKNDDGHKHITYLTFDWYVPQSFAGKDFYWGVSANI